MKFLATRMPDVVVIEPAVFADERGWFMESFSQRRFADGLAALGLPLPRPFVQDNESHSAAGVLRGLHYQLPPPRPGPSWCVWCRAPCWTWPWTSAAAHPLSANG